MKKLSAAILLLVLFGIGFFTYNTYFTPTSTEPSATPVFTWKFEEDDSLNADGIPQTNIFLEVQYPNERLFREFIDTVPSSCNDLPEVEVDSVPGTTNIQCYGAGLGYRYKITAGDGVYRISRRQFEEALPTQQSSYGYEVVKESRFR